MSERNLDQLLKWSIAAQGQASEGEGSARGGVGGSSSSSSSSSDAPVNAAALAAQPGMQEIAAEVAAGKRPDLQDPGLLDALMGGKSEAQMMKEELAVACDERRTSEDRCIALDNFEMVRQTQLTPEAGVGAWTKQVTDAVNCFAPPQLIESIDNANNIKNMGMWPPIVSLLASSDPPVLSGALWIIGTAIQNNDKAQMALLSHQPLQPILASLRWAGGEGRDSSTASALEAETIRSKAAYALSALLKHNPPAVVAFDELDGWQALKSALEDPSIAIRRKVAFLINTLLLQAQQDEVHSGEHEEHDDQILSSAATGATTTSAGTGTDADPIRSASPTRSAAAGLTSLPGQPASSNAHGSAAPSAPLERGPETHREGIAYPNVPKALLRSCIVRTLLGSLLPEQANPPASTVSLRDGGQAREDLDYAEKAARAVASFVESVCEKGKQNEELRREMSSGKGGEARLLDLLSEELEGAPLRSGGEGGHGGEDGEDGAVQSRWQQVGFEAAEWEQLRERASNMAAGDALA